MMLFGLPQLDINTIKDEFKSSYNIESTNVKEVMTARSNIDDALYMIEFDRSQVSKREVVKIRFFYGIVVHWKNPLKRAKGPTQCSKCAMYGHGSSNCHRVTACLGCGGAHDYASCQLNKTSGSGPVVYKCFNCIKNKLKNINHRADDLNCPSRKDYLKVRQKVTIRNQPLRVTQNNRYVLYASEDEDLYRPGTDEAIRATFNGPEKHVKRVSYASQVKQQLKPEDDDLPNEKILEIYFEALDALQKCKNKYDKMRVLGMMLKHVI